MKNKAVEIFNNMTADVYDKTNESYKPISENLHYLNSLILQNLPDNAHILCVGIGTGVEVIKIAKENPTWKFVGIEPSLSMINDCKERFKNENLESQCELFHGFLHELVSEDKFDASMCLFVTHFF